MNLCLLLAQLAVASELHLDLAVPGAGRVAVTVPDVAAGMTVAFPIVGRDGAMYRFSGALDRTAGEGTDRPWQLACEVVSVGKRGKTTVLARPTLVAGPAVQSEFSSGTAMPVAVAVTRPGEAEPTHLQVYSTDDIEIKWRISE